MCIAVYVLKCCVDLCKHIISTSSLNSLCYFHNNCGRISVLELVLRCHCTLSCMICKIRIVALTPWQIGMGIAGPFTVWPICLVATEGWAE